MRGSGWGIATLGSKHGPPLARLRSRIRMTKLSRWSLFLVVSTGFVLSRSPALAQLKIEPAEPAVTEQAAVTLPEDETVAAPAPLHVETAFYIPEPSTYGLVGAAGLCL